MLNIHQQPYWGSTMQLVQEDNTVHLYEDDIARIVAERYGLKEFSTNDLVEALKEHQTSGMVGQILDGKDFFDSDIWSTPSPEYVLSRVSQTITEMVQLGNAVNWNEPISENFATAIKELKAWREEYVNTLSSLAELADESEGKRTKVLILEGDDGNEF